MQFHLQFHKLKQNNIKSCLMPLNNPENKQLIEISNNIGPSEDPWGTPQTTESRALSKEPVLMNVLSICKIRQIDMTRWLSEKVYAILYSNVDEPGTFPIIKCNKAYLLNVIPTSCFLSLIGNVKQYLSLSLK